MIVLDSDVLIEILDKKSEKGLVASKHLMATNEDVAITVINLHEVLFGVYKSQRQAADLLQLPVLSYTKKDAVLSSELEVEAEKAGKPIGRTDTMVAAIAINNNAVLYTCDLKHFETLRNQGLRLFKH